MSEPILAIDGLETCYGLSQVLFGVSFSIAPGEMVTLMGRNGMGKTTTVHAVMGVLPGCRGTVEFDGQRVDHLPSFRIARLGLGLVPEGRQIFPNLSVRENLAAASANRTGRADPWTLARVFEFFPRLAERQGNRGNQLSGGEQQMLAIGRALMTNPDCLIMDEPSEGLAPIIIQGLWEAIGTLKKEGLSILLVEQNANLALKLVDYVHVMSKGQVVYSAKPEELKANDEIKSNYLGI
jgi:branched-chain amino acid transport system ATP-binding protein